MAVEYFDLAKTMRSVLCMTFERPASPVPMQTSRYVSSISINGHTGHVRSMSLTISVKAAVFGTIVRKENFQSLVFLTSCHARWQDI